MHCTLITQKDTAAEEADSELPLLSSRSTLLMVC